MWSVGAWRRSRHESVISVVAVSDMSGTVAPSARRQRACRVRYGELRSFMVRYVELALARRKSSCKCRQTRTNGDSHCEQPAARGSFEQTRTQRRSLCRIPRLCPRHPSEILRTHRHCRLPSARLSGTETRNPLTTGTSRPNSYGPGSPKCFRPASSTVRSSSMFAYD